MGLGQGLPSGVLAPFSNELFLYLLKTQIKYTVCIRCTCTEQSRWCVRIMKTLQLTVRRCKSAVSPSDNRHAGTWPDRGCL